jgi:O-antigen/teichoic acid export membrane protein
LIPGGFEKQYLTATLLGMGVSVLLNLLLIRMFKDKGAAATLLITEGVVSFVAYYFVIRKMNLHMQWSVAVKAFVASLLFIPVALFVRSFTIPLISGISCAIVLSVVLYLLTQLYIFKNPLLKAMIVAVLKLVPRRRG